MNGSKVIQLLHLKYFSAWAIILIFVLTCKIMFLFLLTDIIHLLICNMIRILEVDWCLLSVEHGRVELVVLKCLLIEISRRIFAGDEHFKLFLWINPFFLSRLAAEWWLTTSWIWFFFILSAEIRFILNV